MSETIVLDHGSGGRRTQDLIRNVFLKHLACPELEAGTDAAVLDVLVGGADPGGGPKPRAGRLALTTDAHVVKPLFFPGGDIGRLAVCGTVNDLVVSGADPLALTASFVIEEGFAVTDLETIVASMAGAAGEAGVRVVAGDTKVVERGACDGLFISTTGAGYVPPEREHIAAATVVATRDVVIVTGPIGDHGATIACARNGITTTPPLQSDCAPLTGLVGRLYEAGVTPQFMRDATRGGLGTVLVELAEMRGLTIEAEETAIPVRETVRGVCDLYGFDVLHLANEGTMVCVVKETDANAALAALKKHAPGERAAAIGRIAAAGGETGAARAGQVILNTSIGGQRIIRMLAGEQLPRIC